MKKNEVPRIARKKILVRYSEKMLEDSEDIEIGKSLWPLPMYYFGGGYFLQEKDKELLTEIGQQFFAKSREYGIRDDVLYLLVIMMGVSFSIYHSPTFRN